MACPTIVDPIASDILRYRIWHLPARIARHVQQRVLAASRGWLRSQAFLTGWLRLPVLPPRLAAASSPQRQEDHLGSVGAWAHSDSSTAPSPDLRR
jgi:hypothetical protein